TNGKETFDFELYFSEVFRKGGFDIVIANPPYGAEFSDSEAAAYKDLFQSFAYRAESYVFFIETGVNKLKPGAVISYIVPDTYLNLAFTQKLRSFLLTNTKLKEIFLLPASVFETATVDTTLLFAEKVVRTAPFYPAYVRIRLLNKKSRLGPLSKADREFLT